MTILKVVLLELFSMFVADARLTITIILLVAAVAVVVRLTDVYALVSGSIVLIGCILILFESVCGEARIRTP